MTTDQSFDNVTTIFNRQRIKEQEAIVEFFVIHVLPLHGCSKGM